MSWGLKNRLSKIIKPHDGRTVMLAIDHGYFLGPISGLENPRRSITPLLPYCDAIMPTRGILRNCFDPTIDVAVVLRVSGGESIAGPALGDEEIITSIEEALRLNAAAVSFSIFVGTQFEHQTLTSLARLVDEGERYGMPVLAVTAVGRELEKRDARYLSLACRIAAELGAHFVKTYYCENFSRVADTCPVPLVIAGGPKLESDMDVLKMVYNAIQEGAIGVDMGRNIFQAKNSVGMIKAIRKIIHENATPEEAAEELAIKTTA